MLTKPQNYLQNYGNPLISQHIRAVSFSNGLDFQVLYNFMNNLLQEAASNFVQLLFLMLCSKTLLHYDFNKKKPPFTNKSLFNFHLFETS